MRIIEALFGNLGAFQFAGIETLSVEFNSVLQIIIGTNGSGKSNLLRQLSPRPAAKADYEVDGEYGFRRLTIEHRGSVYTLISDFRKKSHPHQFWKDGVNLNEGGTTGVQDELVVTHLGYTSTVENILRGSYDFAHMSQGPRKTLLIETNPSKLGFILEDHKKVNSRIKACKNNLTMLHERKLSLEAKLIDASILTDFIRESDKLRDDTMANVRILGALQSQISNLRPKQFFTESDARRMISEAQTLRKKILVNSPEWSGLSYDSVSNEILILDNQTTEKKKELAVLEEELVEVVHSLNVNEDAVKELTDASALEEITLKITALEKEYADSIGLKTETPLPKDLLAVSEELLPTLQEYLTRFIGISSRIISVQTYDRKSRKMQDVQFRVTHYRRELDSLVARQEYLKRSQKIRLSDVPKDNCAQMACPLYANFRSTYDEVVAEYKRNDLRVKYLERKLHRAERYVELQNAELTALSQSNWWLQDLNQLIMHPSGVFRQYFRTGNVLNMLSQNPIVYYQRAKEHLDRSIKTYRLDEIETQLVKLGLEKQKHESSSEGTRVRLETLIENQKSKAVVLRQKILGIDRFVDFSKKKMRDLQKCLHTLHEVNEIGSSYEDVLKDLAIIQERKLLEELHDKIQTIQSEALIRLGEISVIIREQDILKSRYTEEVVGQIDVITNERKEWEAMERALNRIPHIHTVTYINAIIGIVNVLIAKIFAYEFKLIPLDVEKPLDYKFKAKVGTVVINDTNTCSQAQSDMVNLAFSLALRFLLGYEDYPIWLDEVGASFDVTHKHRLLDLLRHLVDEHKVSQMFLVNHHAAIHEGLANNETLVLNDANVLTPAKYNEHAVFNSGETFEDLLN